MKWKQFFTPAENMTASTAKTYIESHEEGTFTLLDVRQPGEYENARIPGAKLIPLPELTDRIKELDPEKPVITYCAIGGRSRAAAQLLKGKGFNQVFNLSGGIKAWNGLTAFGPKEMGMEMFSGRETAVESIHIAYGMEVGLGEFYKKIAENAEDQSVSEVLMQLAGIEEKHKKTLLALYRTLTDASIQKEAFEDEVLNKVMEGGFTTEEFISRYQPLMQTEADVLNIAMMLETQAMDLYMRFSEKSIDQETKKILLTLAQEEKSHLKRLGQLLDSKI
jgi:sulfur-carrier protein adenylyltransferase/sulfurtransferase